MDPNEQPTEQPIVEIIEERNEPGQTPPIYQRNRAGDFEVRPSLVERLLSPQSLQLMMQVGGGMLMIGFVVWLWSIGLFENPVVVALAMGGGIAALIGTGIAIVKLTRYQLAGHGLTLLGAMAMPLQLWFYHAQDLINLNDGGRLWIPAAAFCLIYAGIARVLRSPAFVYTLVGGVVLTGMLFLADQRVNQFWNLLPQVTFLVGLGWGCVFAEKWFVETDSDFSRARFGRAFVRSGVVAIVSGLSLLMANQIAGVFFDPISIGGHRFAQYLPSKTEQCWAIGILALTAMGVAFGATSKEVNQSLQQEKRNVLFALSAWIVLCLIGLLNVTVTLSMVAAVFAAVVLIFNLSKLIVSKTSVTHQASEFADLGSTATLLLCVFALVQFCLQFTPLAGEFVIGDLGYVSLIQIALTALAAMTCLLLPEGKRKIDPLLRALMLFTGSATAVAAIWTGAFVFGAALPLPLAIAGLGVPLILSVLSVSPPISAPGSRRSFKSLATTIAIVHMGMYIVFFGVGFAGVAPTHFTWMAVCLTAAAIHYVCCRVDDGQEVIQIGLDRMLTYSYLAASASIFLTWWGMDTQLAIITSPALIGLLLVCVGRYFVVAAKDEQTRSVCTKRWSLVVDYGSVFITFANYATMLLAVNMIVAEGTSVSLAVAIAMQWIVAGIAIALSKSQGWKNGFISSMILLTVTQCAVLNEAIPFSLPVKIEYLTVLVGVLLLMIGHVSWAKEDQTADSGTTAALWFGSLMTAAPLMIALFCYRYLFADEAAGLVQYGHEIAVLASLFFLTAAGILCRIRSTTIVGATGMVIYVASLLTMIPLPEKLQSISVVMMIGGAVFFTTALLLSVYRDRIIAIPQRYRNGDGLFQVLKWR